MRRNNFNEPYFQKTDELWDYLDKRNWGVHALEIQENANKGNRFFPDNLMKFVSEVLDDETLDLVCYIEGRTLLDVENILKGVGLG